MYRVDASRSSIESSSREPTTNKSSAEEGSIGERQQSDTSGARDAPGGLRLLIEVGGELEPEVVWEALGVALDGLVERVTAQCKDRAVDVLDGN